MTRPVDSNSGGSKTEFESSGPPRRTGQGDHLRPKSAAESEFQTQFTPGAVRGTPVKLGSKEYDADLWDSPMMRTLKRAITGWELPPAGGTQQLGRVLKDDDPRLKPTDQLPGREAWRKQLQALVVSAGAQQQKPTAYYLAGPVGVGKISIADRFFSEGVLPRAVVKADADYLHNLVPEQSELTALGDGRGNDVVHEEASAIAKAAYFEALDEKRDVVYNSMFDTPAHLERLQTARAAGFKRVMVAIVAPLDVAKTRAAGGGNIIPQQVIDGSHRNFARNFDGLVKESDELVLLMNTGTKLELLAQGKGGELQVKNEKLYQQFRAMGQ